MYRRTVLIERFNWWKKAVVFQRLFIGLLSGQEEPTDAYHDHRPWDAAKNLKRNIHEVKNTYERVVKKINLKEIVIQ